MAKVENYDKRRNGMDFGGWKKVGEEAKLRTCSAPYLSGFLLPFQLSGQYTRSQMLVCTIHTFEELTGVEVFFFPAIADCDYCFAMKKPL